MRKKENVIILFVISILCCLFVSCKRKENTKSEEPITILAILIGNHANSKSFNVSLDDKIEQAYSSFGNVCVICVDGSPEVSRDEENNTPIGCYDAEFLKKSRNDYKYQEIWKREYLDPQMIRLKSYLNESHADDPEVDTLEALHSAVLALNEMETMIGKSNKHEINKEIIIADTGVCSTGKLSLLNLDYLELIKSKNNLYTDDVMKKRVAKLIDELEKDMELPKLEGVKVTWLGLGLVAKPQPELSKLEVANLQYVWEEILKKADADPSDMKNAESEYFVKVKGYDTIVSDQYVTPVILWSNVGQDEKIENSLRIKEEEIGFQPESAECCSEEEANRVLKPYASNLLNYTDMKILLIGTTSSYNGGSVSLSLERAAKVKEMLKKLGIAEERMVTVGLGYHLEFCENDSPNGEFVESIGKNNRAVLILPLNSEKAQRALDIR